MTGHLLARAGCQKGRFSAFALRNLGRGTAGGKATALTRPRRAEDVRFKADIFEHPLVGIGRGNVTQECLGVGMLRLLKNLRDRTLLDNFAEIHERRLVTHVPHHTQIMRDQQVGEAQFFLEVNQ